MTKKVTIVLASYNGEKYIDEQIKSILNQDYENWSCIIRDDLSSDQTLSKISEYSSPKIKAYGGNNIGVIQNFFELMAQIDSDSEYIAFCDQDDYWLPSKLSEAVKHIEEYSGIPAMYFSSLDVVDKNLNHISYTPKPCGISFKNALVENVVTGCTMLINRKALELVLRCKPTNIVMHDWWIYLIVVTHGTVIYDDNSYIKYRQHADNVVGIQRGYTSKLIDIIDFFSFSKKNKCGVRCQAIEFKKHYFNGLNEDDQAYLKNFIYSNKSIFKRVKFIFNGGCRRQTKWETLKFTSAFFIGFY